MEAPNKDQILEAAKTSPEAKAALLKLFPSVFEDERLIDLTELTLNSQFSYIHSPNLFAQGSVGRATKNETGLLLSVRSTVKSNYNGKAFWLNDRNFEWFILRDVAGELVLVPKKKLE